MRWVVAAILLFIGTYTALTLHYRKPGPPHEPYEEGRARASVHQLLEAGWQRAPATLEEAAVFIARTEAPHVRTVAGGLPPSLRNVLLSPPRLPTGYASAAALAEAPRFTPYDIHLSFGAGVDPRQISEVLVYRGDSLLVIVPDRARLRSPAETAPARRVSHRIRLPGSVMHPGTYRVILAGADASLSWELHVR